MPTTMMLIKVLPQIRKYLLEGKNDSAQALVDRSFICTGPGSGGTRYGCFQMLGNLNLRFSYDGGDGPRFDHYSRELRLTDAMASCTYRVGGVTYKREYLTSYGDDVAIIRFTADQPGKLNCRITMDRPEKGEACSLWQRAGSFRAARQRHRRKGHVLYRQS